MIDRASATDLAFLAMDSGPVGEQIGVILRFEEPTGLEVVDVRRLIARRIAAVPRLRQRLVGVPFGCGRPIWVDHNAFAVGLPADRLRRVHCEMRARKATAPPPIALLGWLFRRLAALGGYRWYMGHQRRFHTLVSYVRGPVEQVDFGGYPIAAAIPVAVGGMGNVTVYFEVLSYAGTLTVTVISDPDHFPDPQNLTAALRDELGLVASSTTSSTPASKRADTSTRQAPG